MNYSIPQEEKYRINRATKYRRQKVSAMLATKYTSHSVRSCMLQTPGNQVTVYLNQSTGIAHYSGLITCGSVWDCPICSAKISNKRAIELKQGVSSWYDQGGIVVMVTYTIRHNKGDRLSDLAKVMTNALRFVHSGAPYKRIKEKYNITGTVSATEIKYNPKFGWHYHKHQLLFIQGKTFEKEKLSKWLYDRYNKYLKSEGYCSLPGIGVNVSDPDDKNNQVGDYINKWGIEDEITRGDHKDSESYTPFELLDNEDMYELFVEYSRAMYGKRRLTYSRGLRALLGLGVDVEDVELASEDDTQDDDLELAIIPRLYWAYIVKHNLRAVLLDRAEISPGDFADWYYHKVIKPFHLQL